MVASNLYNYRRNMKSISELLPYKIELWTQYEDERIFI